MRYTFYRIAQGMVEVGDGAVQHLDPVPGHTIMNHTVSKCKQRERGRETRDRMTRDRETLRHRDSERDRETEGQRDREIRDKMEGETYLKQSYHMSNMVTV